MNLSVDDFPVCSYFGVEVSDFFAVCYSGGDPLPGQKLKPRHSAYPKGIGPEAPAWVAFDRQVSFFHLKFICRANIIMGFNE